MGGERHREAQFGGDLKCAEGEVVVDVVGVDNVGAEAPQLLADQGQGGGVLDAAVVAETLRVLEGEADDLGLFGLFDRGFARGRGDHEYLVAFVGEVAVEALGDDTGAAAILRGVEVDEDGDTHVRCHSGTDRGSGGRRRPR